MSTAATTTAATGSTAAAAPSATTGIRCTNLYETPTRDANCAVPFGGNHTDVMAKCCNGASVVSYYDDCGLYCLAVGQSVKDLTDCLYGNGVAYQDVFCSGNTTATATGNGEGLGGIPTSAQASVVANTKASTATAKSGDSTKTGSSGSSTGSSTSSSTANAAAGISRPQAAVNTVGLAIGGLLVSALFLGFQQI